MLKTRELCSQSVRWVTCIFTSFNPVVVLNRALFDRVLVICVYALKHNLLFLPMSLQDDVK